MVLFAVLSLVIFSKLMFLFFPCAVYHAVGNINHKINSKLTKKFSLLHFKLIFPPEINAALVGVFSWNWFLLLPTRSVSADIHLGTKASLVFVGSRSFLIVMTDLSHQRVS